ncbi:hypothetical protein [Priestia aryabhattai]
MPATRKAAFVRDGNLNKINDKELERFIEFSYELVESNENQ